MFIVNDINMVKDVASIGKANRTQFLIANYGYNYTLDAKTKLPILKLGDDCEFEDSYDCQLKEFFPIKTADFKAPFR